MPYKKTFLLSILIKLKMCSVPIWILPNLQLPAFGLGRKDCAFQSTKVIRSNETENLIMKLELVLYEQAPVVYCMRKKLDIGCLLLHSSELAKLAEKLNGLVQRFKI